MRKRVYKSLDDLCSWCMGERCYFEDGRWYCFDCGFHTIHPKQTVIIGKMNYAGILYYNRKGKELYVKN